MSRLLTRTLAALALVALAGCLEGPPARTFPIPYSWSQPTDTFPSAAVEAQLLPQLGQEVPDLLRDVWGVPERGPWPLRGRYFFVAYRPADVPAESRWTPDGPATQPRHAMRAAYFEALERSLGATPVAIDTMPAEWRTVGMELRARGDTVIAIVAVGAERQCARGERDRGGADYALLFLRGEDGAWHRDADIAPFWVRGDLPDVPRSPTCPVRMQVRRAGLLPLGATTRSSR